VVSSLCRYLPWDSEFFALRIGRVVPTRLRPEDLTSIRQWCVGDRIDCLYFLADADDSATSQLAQDDGFRLVDIRVTLERANLHLTTEFAAPPNVLIRHWHPTDISALSDLAGRSHRNSRFYADPHFSRERADALYRTWIERSCAGDADAVLVAELPSGIAGYVSCHLREGMVGEIGLMAVNESARGAQLGRVLCASALHWLGQHKARRVTVVTQGRNVSAQRVYQHLGFRTSLTELWFHRWFSKEGEPLRG
jgi:dTDP-4-amino-4,6-dideoxy-D-galactose acyltransferase